MDVLAVLVGAVAGKDCTTLNSRKATPRKLQRQILPRELLQPGNRVRLVTVDETAYELPITEIDLELGLVIGSDQQVPIADVVSAERPKVSLGMSTTVTAWTWMCLCGLLLLGSCAAPGPSYKDVMANADPIVSGVVRIFFLRPRDVDDGSNGSAATIEVNQERVGALRYGGFFFVDALPGPTNLTVFGRYRALGNSEIVITKSAGKIINVDFGDRLSHMVAGAIGGIVGGETGVAAVPDVYGSVGAAIATSAAGVAAGKTAGTVAATAIESWSERCRGPHKLEALAEDDALTRLADLNWSGD